MTSDLAIYACVSIAFPENRLGERWEEVLEWKLCQDSMLSSMVLYARILQNAAGVTHSAANTLEIYLATHLPTLPLWMGKHGDY
jgi:hypothetical protein